MPKTRHPLLARTRLWASLLAMGMATMIAAATNGYAQTTDDIALKDFPPVGENFANHQAQVREYLLATQMPQRTALAAEFNLPFELKANRDASYQGRFLLIHGLNDSPYVWRDVANELANRGFDVRSILLPGHGNTPRAQLDISYRTWLKAVREHMNLYRDPTARFFVGGFSMGGVIATLLAAETDHVDGLLLFSPAYRSQMHDILRWAGLYSTFKPWVFGGMIREDNPVKYNSIPINGASQYYKTAQTLKRRWPRKQLEIPVLVVATINDSVIDIEHMKKSFIQGFSGIKHMIVYDNERAEESIASSNIEYRSGRDVSARVLNQSHQSLLISPGNPLYGKTGSILVCNGNEYPIFRACLTYSGTHWYGAQHTPSPDGVPVARATYNPDFDYVMEQFDRLFLTR